MTNDCPANYKVEENTIYSSVNHFATGILSFKPGTNENRIYRNTIFNTCYGIRAANTHLTQPGIPNLLRSHSSTGLQFVCNDFYGNTNDIYVSSDAPIRYFQGTLSSGADNEFKLPRANYNFYLGGQLPVIYYYDPSDPMKEPVHITNNVTLDNRASKNLCVKTLCDDYAVPVFDFGKSGVSYFERYRNANEIYREMIHHFYERGYDKVLSNYFAGIIENEELLKEAMAHIEVLCVMPAVCGDKTLKV